MSRKKIKKEDVVDAEVVEEGFIPDTQPVMVLDKEEDFSLSSEDHRKKILGCVNDLQASMKEISWLLFQAQKLKRYESWGYASFKDYAHRELGFTYAKARALSNMWMHIGAKDPEMFNTMMQVGWDKAMELARVVTKENLTDWMEKAKVLNADDLKKEVRTYILSFVPKENEDAQTTETTHVKVSSSDSASPFDDERIVDNPPPQVEQDEVFYKNFAFNMEQIKTVSQAIRTVREIYPNIQSETEAVAMICGEFIASNVFDGAGEQAVLGLVQRVASQHNFDPILISKSENRVVLGESALREILQEAVSS